MRCSSPIGSARDLSARKISEGGLNFNYVMGKGAFTCFLFMTHDLSSSSMNIIMPLSLLVALRDSKQGRFNL